MFRLEIETSNAAFDDNPGLALSEMLHDLADKFSEGGDIGEATGHLRDVNGGSVGQWQYTPED